jgi:hypothetical protein
MMNPRLTVRLIKSNVVEIPWLGLMGRSTEVMEIVRAMESVGHGRFTLREEKSFRLWGAAVTTEDLFGLIQGEIHTEELERVQALCLAWFDEGVSQDVVVTGEVVPPLSFAITCNR